MCGITGLLHADSARSVDDARLRRMTARLLHRGPDGEGYHVAGPVGLGMRRLAIIDVEGGNQPLYSAEGAIAVVQNGEIYNYLELRQELEALGYRFQTASDTEVLAHGYAAWGENLVQKLNGMWAFALWDATKQRLFLSRDRLGIKPLYYSWDGATLTFGSEIKALLESGIVAEPNLEVLDAYIAFGFVPEPHSMYRHILKLPPAHNLTLQLHSTPQLQQYWQIPTVDESEARRDEAHIVEEFGSLLADAVRLQMRSDVPLGAFLSGGLDSSSIVALASELNPNPVRTFTIGFGFEEYDERHLARLVAERYGTEHVEECVSPADLDTGLQALARHFDEPFGDPSALATYVVSGIARKHLTVTLTGDGGDEVLAGYTRYQGEKFSHTYGVLPSFLRRHFLPGCVDAGRAVLRGGWRRKAERAARVLETANMDFIERITRKQSWSSAELRKSMLRSNRSHVRPALEFVEEAMRDCPARDNFHRLNWFDFKLMLPGQMLTKIDRMTMAHSLEARVPFLDHRLVELMAPVSAQVQLPGYKRKNILRKAMQERLPGELLQASKRGFNVPMREWFQGPGPGEILQQRLARGTLDDLLSRETLNQVLSDHRSGAVDHGSFLWILLQLETWCGNLGFVKEST